MRKALSVLLAVVMMVTLTIFTGCGGTISMASVISSVELKSSETAVSSGSSAGGLISASEASVLTESITSVVSEKSVVSVAEFSEAASSDATEAEDSYEIAMIAGISLYGTDQTFNQATWEGLVKYAEENNISHKLYQPEGSDVQAHLDAIDLAVKSGAKIVVTPGSLFEVPIYEAQTKYPDVTFILLDGIPQTANESDYGASSNVLCIQYSEAQAGFLAGYAVVKDGFTELGIVKGDRNGYYTCSYSEGFLQGVEQAAEEIGLEEGSIHCNICSPTVNYSDFESSFTTNIMTMTTDWYSADTQVIILDCNSDEKVYKGVIAAAKAQKDKWIIGTDTDRYSESDTFITSAIKMLGESVYQALQSYYAGTFQGGTNNSWKLDASRSGIGSAMDHSKFRTFKEADYIACLNKIVDGTYVINSKYSTSIDGLNLKYVVLTNYKFS